MIDFKNSSYVKLKMVNEIPPNIDQLLISEEDIIGTYRGIRDYVTFTNKRVIAINIQGITGKKKDYTSLPYSKIQVFSVETGGTFDLDSELELYFSGLGRVKFEFTGKSDIVSIGKFISDYVL